MTLFRSLKYRIALIITLIAGVLFAIVIYQNFTLSHDLAARQMATKEEVSVAFLEDISRSALLNNECEILQVYLGKLQHQDPDILHIRAADYRGVVVSSTDPSELGTPILNLPVPGGAEWRQKKIVNETGELGTIAIRFSHAAVNKQYAWALKISQMTAVVGLGLLLVAGYFIGHLLTRRLDKLNQAARTIAAGDLTAAVDDNTDDEIGHLSTSFNTMASTIAIRELALQNSEKKFRHLFERAMEGIFVADAKGGLLDVNPAFISILGGDSREAMLGRNLFASIFENEEAFSRFKWQIDSQGFIKDHELTLIANNSTPIVASLTCHTVLGFGGAVSKYEGMIRDITEQKTAEREIARIRNYLNNIIESMPSMLVTLDANSTVTQWNTAACKLTGISAHEAIGKRIYDIAPLFSKYSQQVEETNRCRDTLTLHREHMGQDTKHLYNMTFFPLIANGTAGVAIRLDDITELENKEHQLRQAQKMESIGTLAGGLAHDFNNVLAGILGNLSLFQYKLDHKPEELSVLEIREYLERMETAGQRAVDMVRQLLTLSRKQQTDLVPVDLNLSLKHVRKIGENTFDKSVQVVEHPAAEPAYVLADTTEMEQVLLNLCINAVHSMTIMREAPPWGGTLTVAIEKITVDPIFQKKHPEAIGSAYWRTSVNDTGVGMDTKTAAKIFDPFFTTKEQGKGTGLGLAMVYNIVQQQHGFIDVYSEPGLGSTFNVYLPVLIREGISLPVAQAPAVAMGEGLILVVDDDELVRGMAAEVLEAVGYTVLTATNGQEGVDLYLQHQDRIKAVLLDMAMPVMSGREAFVEMQKINPEVKVLLASGFRKDNRVDEILQLGVKDFLQKPYTITSLASAIKKVIEA